MTNQASNTAKRGGVGKRQQGQEERRLRLVKAASELIAERKDGVFSMPELAKRAGLSLATPYNLFGSKAGVLSQVCERLVDGFNRDDTWMDGLPPCDRIFGVIDRLSGAYERQGDMFRNLWRALYGLDVAEHRHLNLSISAQIVKPLVASLERDGLPTSAVDRLHRRSVSFQRCSMPSGRARGAILISR